MAGRFKMSGRELTLLVVLGGAGVAAIYFGGRGGFGGDGLTQDELDALKGDPPVVNMALLAMDPDRYDPEARNLFKYYTPPPPPVERRPPPPPVERRPPPTTTRPTVKRPPATPAAPQPPTPRFRYLGYLGPKDGKIAVFQGSGEEQMQAQIGELITDNFRLVAFEFNKVRIGYTDERFADQTTELAQENK